MIEYVRAYLPGLLPEPCAETTCLVTNTLSEEFVLDTCDHLTVVSACSGHGAKFAPVIGKLAADAAIEGRALDQFRAAAVRAASHVSAVH